MSSTHQVRWENLLACFTIQEIEKELIFTYKGLQGQEKEDDSICVLCEMCTQEGFFFLLT